MMVVGNMVSHEPLPPRIERERQFELGMMIPFKRNGVIGDVG